jgi:hypothetical protein
MSQTIQCGNLFYGWFDDPAQTMPSYEPPRDAPCLFCGLQIRADDVRTHNLMSRGEYAARSYFYRTHRTCAEREAEPTNMDGFIFDMIARAGD